MFICLIETVGLYLARIWVASSPSLMVCLEEVRVRMCACISLYQSGCPQCSCTKSCFLHSVPQYMCILGDTWDGRIAVNFNTTLGIQSEVVKLGSLVPSFLDLRPAIILPFLWVLTLLQCLLITLSPLRVHCCDSAFLQHRSLSLLFFLKPFSFVCILCTLLLREWGAGKGRGWDWRCIVEQSAVVAAWERVEVVTLGGCF